MTPTLIGIFLETVARHDKPAQFIRRHGTSWEAIPAARALAEVEALALALREIGIDRGDHVALLSETRYEWPISDLAILGLGAVTVPLYPTQTPDQIRFILANAEAKAVIVSTAHQLERVRAVARELPLLKTMVCMERLAVDGVRTFETLLTRGAELRATTPDAFRESAARVRPDDLATIIYTSGTTGEPKGAMLTHGNIASNVEASLRVVDLGPTDTALSFLPLCHIFERMAGLYAMLGAGATIAYAENMESVGANAVELRPTVMTGVPRFYEKVHARVLENASTFPPLRRRIFDWGMAQGHARARAHFEGRKIGGPLTALADRLVGSKIRARVGGKLRFCISGGAPLPAHILEFFFAVGIPIIEGYGLTETSPVICLNLPGRERPASVGHPIPGVEIRIGEDDEILTRGPHVMLGYYKNDEATRMAIRDGWFHTGDVGRIDAEGRLFITDRLKDLLVTAGGKKVAPQPLEARLKQSPWVAEAVLLGDQRPYVVALLVPNFTALEAEAKQRGWSFHSRADLLARPETTELFGSEIERLNAGLAPFEQIKRFALLERDLTQDQGELTPTLKVKRRIVADRYTSLIESLYARPAAVA
jgi:long-chain acyl-CoA synthetase